MVENGAESAESTRKYKKRRGRFNHQSKAAATAQGGLCPVDGAVHGIRGGEELQKEKRGREPDQKRGKAAPCSAAGEDKAMTAAKTAAAALLTATTARYT